MAEMIDEALAGKKPELLKKIERIQVNVRHNADLTESGAPTLNQGTAASTASPATES